MKHNLQKYTTDDKNTTVVFTATTADDKNAAAANDAAADGKNAAAPTKCCNQCEWIDVLWKNVLYQRYSTRMLHYDIPSSTKNHKHV